MVPRSIAARGEGLRPAQFGQRDARTRPAVAHWHHLVVVVASGVEVLGLVLELGPATNGLLPLLVEPVPAPPIELVLPAGVPLLLVVSLLLVPLPAVLPVLGLVVLLEELEPGVASRLLHALSERAAATVSVATAIRVREVFIRKLLEVMRIRKGTWLPYRAL